MILHDESKKIAIIALVSCLAYCNVINAPFLHDDVPAILNNPDVQGRTKLPELFMNDFWGDNMWSNVTHKSYRPITVLLFRGICGVWGNWTTPYHVINVILHSIVSVLFFFVCKKVVFQYWDKLSPFVASLLFALHPIHTEAVCGVVGCAELLSAICFMAALLIFSDDEKQGQNALGLNEKLELVDYEITLPNHSDSKADEISSYETDCLRQRKIIRSKNAKSSHQHQQHVKSLSNKDTSVHSTSALRMFVSLMFAAIGVLCKESGITVLGVMLVYEIIMNRLKLDAGKPKNSSNFHALFTTRQIAILLWGVALVLFRLWIMTWTKPLYFVEENPASYEKETQTRFLTYFYLCWFNFCLLVYPVHLSYDYSYGTIPLITTLWDPRNIMSLLFLILCVASAMIAIFGYYVKKDWFKPYIMGISFMIFPFLPASNFFFPVGFVIAERVLYLPSAGFIVLLTLLWSKSLRLLPPLQRFLHGAMIFLMCFYFVQTFNRNFVWTSQERLFKSGVDIYPHNAKIRYNWGTQLQADGKWSDAAAELKKAIELYPQGYYSAINNLGLVYEKLGKPLGVIEKIFMRAIEVKPNAGTAYYNLGGIYTKQNRPNEMLKVMVQAADKVDEQFSKLIPITREAAKHYGSAELQRIHFKLLKNLCFRDSGARVVDECRGNVLLTLYEYAKGLAEKRENNKFQIVQQQVGKLRLKDAKTIDNLLHALPLATSIAELASIMIK